ncbi:MAG: acyl carrier protein [Planctomycetota bacterium]|nr:acyl carrier protein [Planctomycetota bacterium]
MITKEEVADAVREVFNTALKIGPEKLQPDTKLMDDLSLDSLDMVEVVYELEDRFDVQIPENRIESIRTFQQVVDGLHAAIESKA